MSDDDFAPELDRASKCKAQFTQCISSYSTQASCIFHLRLFTQLPTIDLRNRVFPDVATVSTQSTLQDMPFIRQHITKTRARASTAALSHAYA
eukprot:6180682-Pleurochrysis_carterae.AAC.3